MENRRNRYFLIAIAGMLALILDAKTALAGGQEGVMLCIKSLIPALFPFLFLSALITNSFLSRYTFLNKLCCIMGIPGSCQSILITGLLGGYPVGAQCVYSAYRDGCLTKSQAHRLLGFCSNAGPAFIFGMGSGLFSNVRTVFCLWAVHIISAFIVALLLPGKEYSDVGRNENRSISPAEILQNSVKTMGLICGWVVLFRLFYAFLEKWLLWMLPQQWKVVILGVFELSNGFIGLRELQSESLRFLLSSGMLSFGGICVYLQSVSVTKELGTGLYFPGKVMQTGFSYLLSIVAAFVLYPKENIRFVSEIIIIMALLCIIAGFLVVFRKKRVAILT